MSNHDAVGMQRARAAAAQSRCVRTHVGAAVLDGWGYPAITAWNGILDVDGPCTAHCARCASDSPPRTGYDACLCIHAEACLIARAANSRVTLYGKRLYVTLRPCLPCLRLCVAAGIMRVVYGQETAFSEAEEAAIATFTRITGIAVVRYESEVQS